MQGYILLTWFFLKHSISNKISHQTIDNVLKNLMIFFPFSYRKDPEGGKR